MLYLDNAASTSIYPVVKEAVYKALELNGNPSSMNRSGEECRAAIYNARHSCARAINCHPDEIYFTSGGTESDCWAITSTVLRAYHGEKVHVITSAFEHKAILNTLSNLSQFADVTYISPDERGCICVSDVAAAIRPNTVLVSIMFVNNELGTLQPIEEIAQVCHEHGILIHTDAVQAFGKLLVDIHTLGVDMLSVSGHKAHAPKGVGFLYCKAGTKLNPLLCGGGQEHGLRSGTENVSGIVGLGVAANIISAGLNTMAFRRESLCRYTIEKMRRALPEFHLNADCGYYAAGIFNFSVGDIDAQGLLMLLEANGVIISNGSACDSSIIHPSHVLKAIGLTDKVATNSFRVSFDGEESFDMADKFVEVFVEQYNNLKKMEVMLNDEGTV